MSEQLLTTVLVSAIVALVTTISTLIGRDVFKKMKGKIWKLTWKNRIPKGYVGAEKALKMNEEAKVEIFGRRYTVAGLAEYTRKGEKSFEFAVIDEDEGVERWLEFNGDEIIIWASTDDRGFWEGLEVYLTEPSPISINFLRRHSGRLPLIIDIPADNRQLKVRLTNVELDGEVEHLFGGTKETPVPYRAKYRYVQGILEEEYAVIEGEQHPLYISFEGYGASEILTDISLGVKVKEGDIHLI